MHYQWRIHNVSSGYVCQILGTSDRILSAELCNPVTGGCDNQFERETLNLCPCRDALVVLIRDRGLFSKTGQDGLEKAVG